MTASVVTALITSSLSLLLAVGKIVWDAREKKRERREAARDRLDAYRAPLLAAVDDLGRRIDNIRNDGFLAYLAHEPRRDAALLSTLFRVAQYLAWAEIVYGYADRLRFEADASTKAVGKAMNDVAWTLAADEFDRSDRLANLQNVAVRLVRELDVDGRLVELDKAGEIVNPRWARRSERTSPTRHTDPADR